MISVLEISLFPGQPERSVYGSKRMKNGCLTLTVIFRIRGSIYGLATDELRTVLRTRLPSTIYGSVTNTVYGPFYTVLIKFLFDNSIHCSKYFFLLISILFIQIIRLFIYNDVDDLFNSGMPHVVFFVKTGDHWRSAFKSPVKHR